MSRTAKKLIELRLADDETKECLFECLLRCINWALLDGYALSTYKCSSAGRARMQLDYEQLCRQLSDAVRHSLSSARSAHRIERHALQAGVSMRSEWRALVDAYIRAYYMPEGQLSQWIADVNRKYSAKQLRALIASAVHLNKKTKSQVRH